MRNPAAVADDDDDDDDLSDDLDEDFAAERPGGGQPLPQGSQVS